MNNRELKVSIINSIRLYTFETRINRIKYKTKTIIAINIIMFFLYIIIGT